MSQLRPVAMTELPGADVVVVLGAQVLGDGRPSPSLRRRVDRAVAVALERGIPWFAACGGTGGAPLSEAEAVRDLATAAGVPVDRIVLEDRSTSTFEHVVNLRPIAVDHGWRRLVVVTDPFHLPRACYLFRRAGFDVEGVPAERRGASARRWWIEGYLREIPAWIKAIWQARRL
jgi:uncharacterized SAM-binding protein YcdF (DUF218 family)